MNPSSAWKRIPHALLITSIAFLVITPPARAGLGGMVKKAKDKAAKAAGQKAAPEAPAEGCKEMEFDDVTVELTNDRVENILATFKAAGDAGTGRPALVERVNKVNDERNGITDRHWETIQATRVKRGEVETCYHDGYVAAQERRGKEYAQRALTDPALLAKYQRVAQENNAAAAKGDSAAMQRINQVMIDELAPTREDTLKVKKECGPIPPRSKEEARLEALDKEVAALHEEIAKIDQKVAKAQAKQGGLSQQQWGMALERIQGYLSWKRHPSNKPPCGYRAAELEALEKHVEQLSGTLG